MREDARSRCLSEWLRRSRRGRKVLRPDYTCSLKFPDRRSASTPDSASEMGK